MWQKILVRNKIKISLSLGLMMILFNGAATALETGPRSPEEAEYLWDEGTSAFSASEWEKASQNFQRYISRYPGKPHFLKSHSLLGQSLLNRGEFAAAAKPLRYYADAVKENGEKVLARAYLSQAYLGLRKFHEAFLSAQEAEKIFRKDTTLASQRELLVRTLIAKTQSLIGLGDDLHEKLAVIASDGALQVARETSATDLQAQAWVNSLRLKTWQCGKLPNEKRLPEEQVKDQMDRRGTCLLESLKILQNVYQTQDSAGMLDANAIEKKQWELYFAAAEHPPNPTPLKPKDRNPTQLKRYFSELSSFLKLAAQKDAAQATELVKNWSLSGKAASSRDSFIEYLSKLLPPNSTESGISKP